MELQNILRCPKTGNRLRFDEAAGTVRVEHSDVASPIIEGIIDFCPESRDRVSSSYDKIASRYDPYITLSTIPMRVFSRIIWGATDDAALIEKILSFLPGCFDGVLLDVPVGTGVFTAEFYGRYPDATIIGIDCSLNMLRKARTRFQGHGLENVCLIKADAASLPVGDGAVDIVLSMNGWHAFADKRRTVAEMRRVLRQDGKLVACGYVTGARRLSDSFVRHFGVRNGFFTPPFFTADELTRQFEGFTIVRQGSDKSIAYLEAVNRGDCRTV